MNQETKNTKKFFLIVAIVVILVALGAVAYFKFKKPKELTQEEIIQKQIQELDRLRQEANTPPLTEEDVKKQIDELNRLRQQSLGE